VDVQKEILKIVIVIVSFGGGVVYAGVSQYECDVDAYVIQSECNVDAYVIQSECNIDAYVIQNDHDHNRREEIDVYVI